MSREQIVRDTAYAIWEAEGKPEGRDADHWKQAEARVAASLKNGDAKKNGDAEKSANAKNGDAKPKPSAKGKTATALTKTIAATSPAKAGATKAGPAKKT